MSDPQARPDSHWDVIVIGAGLGGLSAAATLARRGLRVLVLEQHVYAGGYAHHFLRRVRGTRVVYDFDVALHQTGDLSPGRAMHAVLADVGVLDRIRLRRFDVAYRTRGPAHDLEVPADADTYEARLQGLFPEHKRGIRDLFAALRSVDGGRADEKGLPPQALAWMGRSWRDVLREHVRDERFESIFTQLWSYLGDVPQRLCAFTFAQMWCSYHLGGCWYVSGGGQALSDAFVDIITEHRGSVRLRTPVQQILTEGGRVVGVETRRGRFHASVVISNASAPLTFGRLLDRPELADADRKVADALPVSTSIHESYVGMRGDAASLGLPDRLLFVEPHYDLDAQWEALERDDYRAQGLILGNHTLSDPDTAPPGRSVLNVATLAQGRHWLGLEESHYRERKRELESYFLDRLSQAIPDLRQRIEVCETGTPHTMQRYSWNPDGSIYGFAVRPDSHSVLRPQPRTSLPGLYLAGAWTFPAPGFQGAMSSGRHAANLVCQDLESAAA
jgi:prolycopene isomerase